MLTQIVLVGLGGGIGSILRFLTSVLTEKHFTNAFPLSTFIVNIVGCFLIGILIGQLGQHIEANPNLKFLFITGFCGGYTTFSAFAIENLVLIQNQHYWTLLMYVGLSVLSGIGAVWLGLVLTKYMQFP